ncbi:hypothetical protein [Aureimonas sp. SA4125]|uniref:hypothetical protein n=1 Tax=Aureimonas sp. SA4125 TaxID=2826993 RepID=UPI001CC4E0E1|nr:hypothetical protein [Aureimonas sp. SA4125]
MRGGRRRHAMVRMLSALFLLAGKSRQQPTIDAADSRANGSAATAPAPALASP